jgi:hypothetical protein
LARACGTQGHFSAENHKGSPPRKARYFSTNHEGVISR